MKPKPTQGATESRSLPQPIQAHTDGVSVLQVLLFRSLRPQDEGDVADSCAVLGTERDGHDIHHAVPTGQENIMD